MNVRDLSSKSPHYTPTTTTMDIPMKHYYVVNKKHTRACPKNTVKLVSSAKTSAALSAKIAKSVAQGTK